MDLATLRLVLDRFLSVAG